MNSLRVPAFVLLAAGALALAYGGFSYTRQTHEMSMGPIEMSVSERQTVNVPVWAGVGAMVIGGVMLLLGGRKP